MDILKHVEIGKGVAGGVCVDQLGEVHHQLLLVVQLGSSFFSKWSFTHFSISNRHYTLKYWATDIKLNII